MAGTSGRVNVFARLRPFAARENESFAAVSADEAKASISVEDAEGAMEQALRVSLGAQQQLNASFDGARLSGAKKYEFDGVFDTESSQAEVFAGVGLPVLNAVLEGYHGCVFAYGQTGSGKTYTLLDSGSASDGHREAGLLPRLVATLFVRARMDAAHVYAVEASSFQVYNEQVDDLLHPTHREGDGHNLAVSRTPAGNGVVDDLTWLACSSANELLELFGKARKNIVYAETRMNKASSRSHACFQLRVSRRPRQGDTNRGTVATLAVIDLAGSERVKRSGVTGKEFKEAVNINGSLLALGNVVSALATGKKHVPFRDSKLTRLLEGRVGGNCRTNLIVCCSPSADSASESVSALSFAARAMKVTVSATINEFDDVLGDATGLAVVPAAPSSQQAEAARKTAQAEAAAAVESRRRAEEALHKERVSAERKVNEEREKAAKNAARQQHEAALRLEKAQAKAAADVEAQRLEAQTSKKAAVEHEARAMDFKAKRDELETANKQMQASLATTTSELAAAKQAAETEQRTRRASEAREKTLRAALEARDADGAALAQKLAASEEERVQNEARIAAVTRDMAELEASALETKKELDATLESLASLQRDANEATAQHQRDLEKAASERERLNDALELARAETRRLDAAATAAKFERDAAVAAITQVQRDTVVESVASTAIAQAQREALQAQNVAAFQDSEARHRAALESQEAEFQRTVQAHTAELEAKQNELHATTKRLQVVEAEGAQERQRLVDKHDQLERQLEALEERARVEIHKAEQSRDAAATERAALVEAAKVLESRLREEARASADLAAEIARVRDESVAAAREHQAMLDDERDRGNQMANDLEELADRFAKREPRSQDLEAIDKLRATVEKERQRAKDLMQAALLTQRELEHTRHVDRVFGQESAKHKRQREIMRRVDVQHVDLPPQTAGGGSRPTSARRRPSSQAKVYVKPTHQHPVRGAVKHSMDF